MHSQAGEDKISWDELNQEMANLGSEQFDAETFKQVYDTVPAIKNFVDSFENALSGPNFNDTLIGYSKYIDVNSFIDLYIINELSRNIDGYRLSTYMYKDRDDNGGKLTMGPFWDYNLAFGNANYCNGELTAGWEVDDGGQGCAWNNPFWFERLLEDSNYVNKLKCRCIWYPYPGPYYLICPQ